MSKIDSVRSQVQTWLVDRFNGVSIPDGFDFLIPGIGSTACFIDIVEFGENVMVKIVSPVLVNVTVTNDLYLYIGQHADDYKFGHLSLFGDGPEQILVFSHSILGNDLDIDELMLTISLVASTADGLDDELQARFGGQLFNR